MEITLIQTVTDFISHWVPIIVSIVGSFAIVATLTPNKTDDKIIQIILDVVNFLGANFGKSKNSGDEPSA